MSILEGVITALITPFKGTQAEIDYEALEGLIHWQIEKGIRGFVVAGTTGESATLNATERIALVKQVVSFVNKRVPIVVGTGTNCTKTTIEYTRSAKELGADAVLVVSPYYNKPTQEGLFQHFSAVAKEGGMPIVVYNIPGRTSVDISIETFEKLSRVREIFAIKESSASADKLMALAEKVGDKFEIFSGEDALTYLILAAGGKGVISAVSNVIPEEMVAITECWKKGAHQEALKAQLACLPITRALFKETNPAPAKAALKILGRIPNDSLRLPLVSVGEETRKTLQGLLQ